MSRWNNCPPRPSSSLCGWAKSFENGCLKGTGAWKCLAAHMLGHVAAKFGSPRGFGTERGGSVFLQVPFAVIVAPPRILAEPPTEQLPLSLVLREDSGRSEEGLCSFRSPSQ